MDKTSNGLNATAAYDLACRYNNLFQYNPAAIAACAAAYGNIFTTNSNSKLAGSTAPGQFTPTVTNNTTTNSVSSPTNSSVSSSSSNNTNNNSNSSQSSINNIASVLSPKSKVTDKSISKLAEEDEDEEEEVTNKQENKTFESVYDEINNSIKSDVEDELLGGEEGSLTSHLTEVKAEEQVTEEEKKPMSRSSSISSMNSRRSSVVSRSSSFIIKDECGENNTRCEEDEHTDIEGNTHETARDEIMANADKAIEGCFEAIETHEEYEDDLEKTSMKKQCTEAASNVTKTEQASLGSILDSLTSRCSPAPVSSPESTDPQTTKLLKKVDDLKGKLTQTELNSFKLELLSSVNEAIQQTFKKFFEQKVTESSKPTSNQAVQEQSKPRNLPPPSHNFNMSNLLNTQHHHKKSGVRVGDLNKRKLSTNNATYMDSKQTKYSAHPHMSDNSNNKSRSLVLNTHHSGSTPSLSSSSSTSSTSNKQHSMVNQFYSAALSHLQQTNNPQNQQKPSNNFNMNSLVNNNMASNGNFPVTSAQYHANLLNSQSPGNMASLFSHGHNQQQQHQFLLSAAAAAAASVNPNQGNNQNGPNSSYFNMAAAANRLFTPYLLEHHHQNPSSQPLISTPNAPKSHQRMVNGPGYGQHPLNQSSSSFSHVPGKRRRTKVTDTRLSPRNNNGLGAGGSRPSLLQCGSGLGMHGSKHSMNTTEGNDMDDQENYNQDFDDNSHKFMGSNQDESEINNTNGHNLQMNDEDSMSDYNDQSGGQLATMPNGCFSSGLFGKGELQPGLVQTSGNAVDNHTMDMNMTSEYNGYQTATLSSLHLRKAKLMFFFSRYPSSTILRNYFPDVKFNKANTAQLVKWFSNFREFFYIQMEKYARQHLAEGIQHADELHVDTESEIFRALNSHYNRNNQLEIPPSFCYVIEATLKEFFNSIQEGKDMDPSWKKAIYKVIARMDDSIPEFFKSIKWMETLESSI